MKSILLLLCYFSIASLCNAQKHYSCEKSLIGKIITKPLLKNGDIHYELANKEIKEYEFADGTFIVSMDSIKQTLIIRAHHLSKDSVIQLEFNSNGLYNDCNYFISLKGKKYPPLIIRIDSNGRFEKTEHSVGQENKEYGQSQVDSILKYFE